MPETQNIRPLIPAEMDPSPWSAEYFDAPIRQIDKPAMRTHSIVQVYVFVAVAIIIADIFLQYFIKDENIGWAILTSAIGVVALVIFGLYIFERVNKQAQFLKEMLNIDRTTGLYSSVFLMEELDRIVSNGSNNLVLLFLDLDDLKEYNDTHGHRAGDKLIHNAAEALAEAIMGQGVGFRYGGDEFVAILENVPIDSAIKVAKRVHRLFEARNISASIGLYQWHKGMTVDELLYAADKAMYSAKKTGKGRIYFGDIDTSDIADAAHDEMI